MLNSLARWLGFTGTDHQVGGHAHLDAPGQGHTHGVVDPSIARSATGIWAVKWSFAILAITAVFQLIVVFVSGSVALLADTIHNIGDATTAIPLWIAFALARRRPSRAFGYGLGRVEDLAGVVIVLIILVSAIVAGYEAIDRLLHPQEVTAIGWVAAAGIIGFIGNEAVAVFRIRVGRSIDSAALIADGYHARADGLTSLAVVLGAAGVSAGLPLADPMIGLVITLAILGIVWQSGRAVFTRLLDGVEPGILDDIGNVAARVPGIKHVVDVRARWIGHRLHADVTIATDAGSLQATANAIGAELREELGAHLPALGSLSVMFGEVPEEGTRHHHAPSPYRVVGNLADGLLEIADTPAGERMVLRVGRHAEGLRARVSIDRGPRSEELELCPSAGNHHRLESKSAPAEPHGFKARLLLSAGGMQEELPFEMFEPAGHH